MAGERWVPVVGELVAGRYRIEKMLGQGGMGVVVGAKDEKDGRAVALKILQMEGHVNLERFLREARVATKIASDHVVKVFDVGVLAERNDQPFLVMERLDGSDFGARLKKLGGPLPAMTVADCVVQVCEALAHAHGAGVIHRDIKASNVFEHRQSDGTTLVKVLDFGIARYRAGQGENESTLTTTNDASFLGSPPYMSPEHVRDARSVDGRADLWSLGIVAYRLLSGRFPFRGESTGEVLAAILEQEAPSLRELGHDVPEALDAAIARCLRRSRDDRYSNAAEVAADFAPFCSPRWAMLHLQIADIARRSPALLIPEPSSKNGRISRVDAEPQTMTVAPPVSVSQPPPAEPSSRSSITARGARASRPPEREGRSRLGMILFAVVALALVGGGVFASRRYLRLGPRDGAITAPPPSVATSAPPIASSVALAPPAPSAEPEPTPAPDPTPATKKGTKTGRPLAGSSRPRASNPTTAPSPSAPPVAPPPTPAPAVTKKPDLHPNPYGNGE